MIAIREISTSPALWRLTIHFSVLSMVAAYLIGMGQHSSNPLLLVSVAAILALVNSDWLGWLRINRTFSYILMLVGTGIALYGYWLDRQSHRYYGISNLNAVANMLIYIQLPLMFQRKDPRLFEHWGAFLLLELVVAILLNDNVLFGMLLVPALMIGCSTLLALATYNSYELAYQTKPDEPGIWSQLKGMFGIEQPQPIKPSDIRTLKLESPEQTTRQDWRRGVWWGIIPGFGLAIFAIAYFFVLPRLHTGSYEGLGFTRPMVGFSGSVSLEDFGELLTNDDPALRFSMQEPSSLNSFTPLEPPYIRGTVADLYDGRGRWRSSHSQQMIDDILSPNEVREELQRRGGTHLVTIHEQTRLGATQFSMPPFFRSQDASLLQFDKNTWCLRDKGPSDRLLHTKKKYRFESSAYQISDQVPFLVDVRDSLEPNPSSLDEPVEPFDPGSMRAFDPERFEGLIALRDEILNAEPNASPIEKALLLEDYLSSSRKFKYSLLPQVNRENGLDPIEDFAANHRTGHCQYFASTLAIMLRSIGLPSRIVLGFRPSEYNDIGNYFIVRQRHAHAWVEVHLEADELENRDIKVPEWARHGIWLRLDPTPIGEGSNAGGSLRNASRPGQTLEAFEQFWQDNVMDYDSSRQPEIIKLFGASGNSAIGWFLGNIERFTLRLQSNALGGSELSTENWFSWRSSLVGTLLAVMAVVAYRGWRSIQWGTDSKRRRTRSHKDIYQTPSWSLFSRMHKALEKMGLRRQPYQTPFEFVEASQNWLRQRMSEQRIEVDNLLPIVEAYYATRYGSGIELTSEEWKAMTDNVLVLESLSARNRSFFRRPMVTSLAIE